MKSYFQDFDEVVYHGSPHNFDKFSLQHIGSGEGAQVFGWGLYFGTETTAKSYQQKLSLRLLYRGKMIAESRSDLTEDQLWTLERVDGLLEQDGTRSLDQAVRQAANMLHPDKATWLRSVHQKGYLSTTSAGCLYEVEIPNDEELLDYDKLLSDQPKFVKHALELLGFNLAEWPKMTPKQLLARVKRYTQSEDFKWQYNNDMTLRKLFSDALTAVKSEEALSRFISSPYGRGFVAHYVLKLQARDGASAYNELSQRNGRDPKAASEAFLQVRIPGLRYLDQGSRDAGKGTYNYVIWDESRIKLINKTCGR
jgi:hypothetical protein